MKTRKLFGATVFGITLVTFIMVFIASLISLNNISEAVKGYSMSSAEKELYNLVLGMTIAGAAVAFTIAIITVVGIYKSFNDSKNNNSLLNLATISFGFFTLLQHIKTALTISKCRALYRYTLLGVTYEYEPPAISIWLSILCALAVLIIGISLFVDFDSHKTAKKIICGLGMIVSVVAEILSVISGESNNGFTITIVVFTFISMFVTFVYCVTDENTLGYSNSQSSVSKVTSNSEYRYTQQQRPMPTKYESSVGSKETYKPNNVNPMEELRKLKSLFDDGIITKEEYEEKRKKYIDKL